MTTALVQGSTSCSVVNSSWCAAGQARSAFKATRAIGGVSVRQLKRVRSKVTAQRRQVTTTAVIDPQVAIAVSQQQAGFAILVGAEGAFNYLETEAGTPGRPEVSNIALIGGASFLTSFAIHSGNDLLTPISLVAALGLNAFSMYSYFNRYSDTPPDPLQWPGPKVWPGTLLVASFFVFLAVTEGLTHLNVIG